MRNHAGNGGFQMGSRKKSNVSVGPKPTVLRRSALPNPSTWCTAMSAPTTTTPTLTARAFDGFRSRAASEKPNMSGTPTAIGNV